MVAHEVFARRLSFAADRKLYTEMGARPQTWQAAVPPRDLRDRPLSLLFIVLSVLVVVFGLRREFRMRAAERRQAAAQAAKEAANVG